MRGPSNGGESKRTAARDVWGTAINLSHIHLVSLAVEAAATSALLKTMGKPWKKIWIELEGPAEKKKRA
jgi:hypothetical protein